MNTPIRIHLTFSESPVGKALAQTIGGPVSFVSSKDEADLIMFTDVKTVETDFDPNKPYIYLQLLKTGHQMPANVQTIVGADFAKICAAIAKVRENLTPTEPVQSPHIEEPLVELLPDALRILVVDDTPDHIASARRGLAGHRLTTATGYVAAMGLLATEEFDVVLTDLHLPMSSQTMGNNFRLGELVPYGFLIMLEAARKGAKKVAVVTDINHHDHPLAAAFDHFSALTFTVEGATTRMLHAKVVDGGKDWADALMRLE